MRFTCHYLNRTTGEQYWKTVWADTETEAYKQASRFARKGFILINATSH